MDEFRRVWFAGIETREQCMEIIRHVSILYLVYSIFIAVTFLFTGSGIIVQGIIFALLALALRKWRSNFISIGLLVATLFFLATGILQIAGVLELKRPNVLILTILVWAAYRGVRSTMMLSGPA